MISYEIGGFFSKEKCEKIKKIMQGKTFYNFDIQYGGYGCQNQQLIVSSKIDGYTSEELKDIFIYACLNELAKLYENN